MTNKYATTIKVRCPICGKMATVPLVFRGHVVECPTCQQAMYVPVEAPRDAFYGWGFAVLAVLVGGIATTVFSPMFGGLVISVALIAQLANIANRIAHIEQLVALNKTPIPLPPEAGGVSE
ncbi:MAG: hypothetical protein J6Y19_10415 [Kiritimatiellae bacterium]|nr:hypothetical protein [Kiritimatiellia bacterium]